MKSKLINRKCLLSRGLAVGLLLVTLTALAEQPQSSNNQVRIVVQDETGALVAGAAVQLKFNGTVLRALDTDEKGVAVADNLPAGDYEVTVSKDGFEIPAQKKVSLTNGNSVEIKFALTPKSVTDKVDINASNSAAGLPELTSSSGTEIQVAQAKYLPNMPKTATDLLPLVPGVIRYPDGGINISGSSENRSAFIVNSADVTDPATGQFGMTVPVDSVQSINVFKTPYMPQYGRFTAGVASVETHRRGDTLKFQLNDPLPEFRYFSGHLRGLRDATPRVVFNGPLIKNRLFVSQGTEYAIRKRPVQTLEFPNKESKSESVNSFTQLDYLFSGTHTLTGTFHLAPRKDSFISLDFFNRRPLTPTRTANDPTRTPPQRPPLRQQLLAT